MTLDLTVNSYTLSGDAVITDSLTFAGTGVTGCVASGNQACAEGTVQGLTLQITENLSLSDLTNLFLQANLSPAAGDNLGSGIAMVDPNVTLILPAGVTYTSQSSVFLTEATPLPAALPLFATGLGGLGLLGWRRKRKAQVA